MADFLNLALSDYTDTASKVSLLSDRWKLLAGSWQPKVSSGRGRVTEVLSLRADGTVAQIATGESAISGLLEQARRWHEDPLTENGVWLEWSVNGETGAGTYAAKRAFVFDGALDMAMPSASYGAFATNSVLGKLALVRHACWERMTVRTITTANLSLSGGVWNLTAESAYAGTDPARIESLEYSGFSATQRRMWIGIRPVYEGIGSFTALWECENGTNGTDTTDVADAGASGGYKVRTTFGTATLTERFRVRVDDVYGSNYSHAMGRYLVLIRAKNSAASTTCYMRMRSGFYAGSDQEARGELVAVESTDWHLYELGQVSIPGVYRYENDNRAVVRSVQVLLDAERVSGAGYLDMDCLILIPAESLAMLDSGPSVSVGAGALITYPDDSAQHEQLVVIPPAVTTGITYPDLAVSNWNLCRTPGVLVAAGEQSTGHVLTDNVDLEMNYYSRWRLYRGV